ncbi:hypothetical protein PILCRDRAFT_139486 [Piloderma croceum F 1598]|uniref:Uncharacterized protein n=1 Tax=Piloderma croceum (strain F 1598) TaxID=765440 RepID=A0A0C3GJI2_PILCF|nr:hypothetical protein PILCRDRAFT_139486 [Piloderma croceum F 1598]
MNDIHDTRHCHPTFRTTLPHSLPFDYHLRTRIYPNNPNKPSNHSVSSSPSTFPCSAPSKCNSTKHNHRSQPTLRRSMRRRVLLPNMIRLSTKLSCRGSWCRDPPL